MTDTTAVPDRPAKLRRLGELLERHDAREIVLTAPENLAWLLDGARVAVPYAGPPVLRATVTRNGEVRVTAFVNEVDRLSAEELAGVEVIPVPWFEPLPAPGPGALVDTSVVDELRALRAPLLPRERERYAALGRDAAHAVTAVLRRTRPDDTERGIAAELARALVAIGAEPVVVLVGGESRSGHRHPLPTAAPLGRRAMGAVGAKRHGLVVSLTRWVRFAPLGDDVDNALLEVEADAFAATVPGRTLGDVLTDIAASYGRHGFAADEWQRHHQGGPTGYLGRDPRATPDGADRVATGQAFAWNPTAPGAKVEDTVIVEDGIHVLTHDPAWPTRTVRGIPRPVALDLG